MNIIVADDKQLAINSLLRILREIDPSGTHTGVLTAQKAIELVQAGSVDVAFLDIEMPKMNGLELAKCLKDIQGDLNIVFVTGHPEYALDAHRLYVSGFLCKPVEQEDVKRALENLRHPITLKRNRKLQIRCFGNFEVYADGEPLKFARSQSKELLAYLVDRKGATCTMGELVAAIWEDKPITLSQKNQLRNLIHDLKKTLEEAGAGDILMRRSNELAIRPDLVDCDYFDFLHCEPAAVNQYRGEYMNQYSWAEMTNAGFIGKL